MQQEAISKILNGTEQGFIREIEEGLARERRLCSLTESIIRSPRNYLAEGGILRVLLLGDLSVKKQLGLFYVLAYIYGVYSVKYPEGTPRMEDNDYVLYSKVEAELILVVPALMQMLKDTYEAWIVNEIVWYGGMDFHCLGWPCQSEGPVEATVCFFYPVRMEGLKAPSNKTCMVWSKRDNVPYWSHGDWGVYADVGSEVAIGRAGVIEACAAGRLSTDDTLSALKTQRLTYYTWEEAPEEIYVLPKTLQPSLHDKYFKSHYSPPSRRVEVRSAIGQYEALYGPVTLETIFRFDPHIEQLTGLSEGTTCLATTERILKFYRSYLAHPSTNWKQNIATISILLNVAHNNGSMSEDLGSKYTTTKEHGVDDDYLYTLSTLHRYVPQGTDHKTLRRIYNECFHILAKLR